MNEREALLRAVCENPDEDTPRLVFADWLQENGEEERAEFIRLQVQAERFPLSSKARQAFFARERELLVRHETIWRAELPNGFYGHPFIRGFTEGANLGDHHPFGLSELTALFEAAPLVELTLFHLSDPGMLATLPSMGRLRRLEIGLQDPTDGSVERFLRATNLTGLQRLIVFTSSAVGWNSAGVSMALTERFRSRFRGVFQER